METFHRIAGMTETSNNLHDQPSHPIPDPPPIPDDADYADTSTSNRASRASLPLNRRASHKSFRSGKSGRSNHGTSAHAPSDYPPMPAPNHLNARESQDSARSGGSEAELQWGPSHPCFPHPNPHCAPDSEEYQTTRVIRVRRDWLQAGDLYPQYANLYPEILDPLVTDLDFRFLVTSLNSRLKAMFDPYSTRAWLDSVMGVATGYIWEDLGLTGVKKGVRELEAFIDKWNREKAEEGKEVRVVQLRRTGFMSLDFVVPDPKIDVVAAQGREEGDEGEGEGGIGPAE